MKKALYVVAVILLSLILCVQAANAQAEVPPDCYWDNIELEVVCLDSGAGGSTGGSNGGNESGGDVASAAPCIPGAPVQRTQRISISRLLNYDVGSYWVYYWHSSRLMRIPDGNYDADSTCVSASTLVDSCTGEILYVVGLEGYGGVATLFSCPAPLPPATNPCDISASWTGSSFSASCNNIWECIAAVPLPPTYIDVRPYPVTLVRWPTAIRCSGQGTSNGSCFVSTAGQMRNLRLSLEFRPATGVVTVTLPYLPALTLNASSPTAQPVLFQWEVPSHPAVGGNVLAGTLGGFFDEIPADFPVFVGQMKTPYRLYWRVSFERIEYGSWVGYSFNGELLPQNVRDLPASMIADLNGDGTGDAYWDPNFVISRMDENNRTNNPLYERHWSYGELLPWAIREGQGQIGWPGVP